MPLVVDQLELGPIGTNTYLVRAPGSLEAVVIDPSGDVATILETLDRSQARCVAILVTHGHFDHIVSLADLAEQTGAPIFASAGERMLLEDPSQFAPPGLVIRPAVANVWLVGGEKVEAGGISFAVQPVPGHSPAHLAYFADDHLFSGDVLFAGSVGRTDLPGADWDSLESSIGLLIDAYPSGTTVHPGHGPKTTLGEELARNPFLTSLRAARTPG